VAALGVEPKAARAHILAQNQLEEFNEAREQARQVVEGRGEADLADWDLVGLAA
jgi:hypothetical protein